MYPQRGHSRHPSTEVVLNKSSEYGHESQRVNTNGRRPPIGGLPTPGPGYYHAPPTDKREVREQHERNAHGLADALAALHQRPPSTEETA
jgi:hypothetical protein